MKVFISAYACEPRKGSEPGVGWNWAKQIAKFAETWVITRANNRGVIEEEMSKSPISNLHFLYYDVPKWVSFWKKKTRGLYLYYLLWQIGAYRIAKKINNREHFNVVHHLTFGNIWLPTFMPLLPVPFIWGPVGGGEQVPKSFVKEFDIKSRTKEIIRNIIISTLKINLFFLYTCRKAKVIIAKTKDTADKIPALCKSKIIITTDVSASPKNLLLKNKTDENIQIISVGRLDSWRGFDLLIKAVSILIKKYNRVTLLIAGDGPEKQRLQNICKRKKLEDQVVFAGQISRDNYLEYMSKSSIFVNPCLKEGGVTVLFDALLFGLPVICMDIPGAPDIVNYECGVKIKPVTPEQTIKDLSNTLFKLITSPELRKKLGDAGKKKVEKDYSWEKKGELINSIYAQVALNE